MLEYLVGEGYKVTALVRRREHGEALKKCGAEVVMGSLDDRDLIAEHAAKNDVWLLDLLTLGLVTNTGK